MDAQINTLSRLIFPDAHELYIRDLYTLISYQYKLYRDLIGNRTEEGASSRVPRCHLMSRDLSSFKLRMMSLFWMVL